MQGLLPRHLAAPTGLAVNRHHRACRQGRQHTAYPATALLHGASIQQAKQPAKRVVGRNSTSELQKSPQPVDPLISPCFDANKIVHATKQCADRHHQHLHQIMLRASRYTRIRKPGKGDQDQGALEALPGNAQ